MSKILSKLKKPRYIVLLVILAVIVVGVVYATGGNEPDFETQTVGRGDVVQSVSETGLTKASREVDLEFEQSGRVARVLVGEGDQVSVGSVLVELDSSEQVSSVLSAEANLKVEQANLADMLANVDNGGRENSNLSTTKQQQEAIIENAYTKLLSEGLVVEPSNKNNTQTAPTVSGRYLGPEGEYKIIVRRGSQVDDYELYIFGIETIRDVEISETGPTPLGTNGLFITFPDSIGSYVDTIWYLTIPNTKSSSYLANYNAYISAKEGANVTLTQTEVTAEKIQAQRARVEQAEASLSTARNNLSKRSLRAPFSGTVTSVEVEVGEVASPGVAALSLISAGDFEIELNIPEADIANVEVGDQAIVTFDAYDDAEFTAEVISISPSAKLVDGVPSFETILRFLDGDERVKSGLSADAEIMAAVAEDVLFIPSRALFEKDDGVFVRVVDDTGQIKEQAVVTGLRGSLGTIEIKEGLNEGDEIITFISEEVLQSLDESE